MDDKLFNDLFVKWKSSVNMSRDFQAAFLPAIQSFKDPVALVSMAYGKKWDMETMAKALKDLNVDTASIEEFLKIDEQRPTGGSDIVTPSTKTVRRLRIQAGTEPVIPLASVGTLLPKPVPVIGNGPRSRLRMDRTGMSSSQTPIASSVPGPEVVEENKGWFKKAMAWRPFKKKEEEPTGEISTSQPRDKKSMNGLAKWALLILFLMIVLISVGALFKLNASQENQPGYSSGDLVVTGETLAVGGTEACFLPSGENGIKRYILLPLTVATPNRGFANELMTVPNENTPALDPTKTYYAIKVGQNYLVVTEINSTAYFRLEDFAVNSTFECVEPTAGGILTIQAEKKVEGPAVELVYRIDLGHWSGLMVMISLIAVFCFALISLSYTGNGRWDLLLFAIASLGTMLLSKLISLLIFYFRPLFPYLSVEAVSNVERVISGIFITIVIVSLGWAISAGSKSETRQFSDQYKAGSQFTVPKSYQAIFDSLVRGFGFVGGFDFTMAIDFCAFFVVVGALAPTASPFYQVFHNQIWSVIVLGVLIAILAALETWRRGMSEDWKSYWFGFVGLVDFLILIWLFGNNPPTFQSLSSTALAVILSLIMFVVVFGFNFWFQSKGERTEIARDRMADGMLFYSCMKLVAILSYILLFIMKVTLF